MKIKNAYEKENKKLQPIEIIKWTDKENTSVNIRTMRTTNWETNQGTLCNQPDDLNERENVNQNDQAN